MPKLAPRSQLTTDAGTIATARELLKDLQHSPRARNPLTKLQQALVDWLSAGREAIEEEERERGVHEARLGRRLGLTARAGLLAGYPDDANGRRTIRRDLDRPNVLAARLQAAQRRILDAQLPAVNRLADLSQNAKSERVSRDASKDIIELGGLTLKSDGAAGRVSINISLDSCGTPIKRPPTVDAEPLGTSHDIDER